jgi:hypothetical protein
MRKQAAAARLSPFLVAAVVICLLFLDVAAPWLQKHAPAVREGLRDVTAVFLVTLAYWLLASVLRATRGRRMVRREDPADWFDKYRDVSDPERRKPAPAPPVVLPDPARESRSSVKNARGSHVNAEPAPPWRPGSVDAREGSPGQAPERTEVTP